MKTKANRIVQVRLVSDLTICTMLDATRYIVFTSDLMTEITSTEIDVKSVYISNDGTKLIINRDHSVALSQIIDHSFDLTDESVYIANKKLVTCIHALSFCLLLTCCFTIFGSYVVTVVNVAISSFILSVAIRLIIQYVLKLPTPGQPSSSQKLKLIFLIILFGVFTFFYGEQTLEVVDLLSLLF